MDPQLTIYIISLSRILPAAVTRQTKPVAENYCPSLMIKDAKKKLPSNIVQARNAKMVIQCSSCDTPRLVFSLQSLKNTTFSLDFEKLYEDDDSPFFFKCGVLFEKIEESGYWDSVIVDPSSLCNTPVEQILFSMARQGSDSYRAWAAKAVIDLCGSCGLRKQNLDFVFNSTIEHGSDREGVCIY